MQWWAWIAVGAILLVLELTLIAADFYLVFLGVAALVIGICDAGGILDGGVAAVAGVCAHWRHFRW